MRACARCKAEALLVALHGDRGGPDVCMKCGGELASKGRAAAKRTQEMFAWLGDMGFGAGFAVDDELDAETGRELLVLAHPDLHTDARKEAATRATASPNCRGDGELEPTTLSASKYSDTTDAVADARLDLAAMRLGLPATRSKSRSSSTGDPLWDARLDLAAWRRR